VVDAAKPTPVLAAGGIVEGRGLAAALMLGAEGVLMGTRFYAATEASGHERAKERIVAAGGGNTQRTRVFDLVRGHEWPEAYTGRALRNTFLERWDGREEDLAAALDAELPAFQTAEREGNVDTAMVWAGEAVDLISDILPAAELVARIGAEAEACLRYGNELTDASH
jgi:nitronate monooxygenase